MDRWLGVDLRWSLGRGEISGDSTGEFSPDRSCLRISSESTELLRLSCSATTVSPLSLLGSHPSSSPRGLVIGHLPFLREPYQLFLLICMMSFGAAPTSKHLFPSSAEQFHVELEQCPGMIRSEPRSAMSDSWQTWIVPLDRRYGKSRKRSAHSVDLARQGCA